MIKLWIFNCELLLTPLANPKDPTRPKMRSPNFHSTPLKNANPQLLDPTITKPQALNLQCRPQPTEFESPKPWQKKTSQKLLKTLKGTLM